MIDVLYEDKDIVVCKKPIGVSSQDSGENSMPCLLKSQLCSGYIATVHRLDTAVSGVMVYAKTPFAAADLSKQIQAGEFEKYYLAAIAGVPDKPSATLADLLFKDSAKNKSYIVKRQRAGVKKASLEYETINTAIIGNQTVSLLKIKLHTGRTHQIRVQFASRKMPLIGDRKYGSTISGSIALFSHKLGFSHPRTKEKLEFELLPDKSVFPWDNLNLPLLR